MKNPLSTSFGLLLLVLLLAASGMAGAAEPVANSSGSSAKHAVAITFDDGPSPRYTPQILALLKQYQAKATFFVLGCKVEKYPAVIKDMLSDGHELGNHTHSHPRLLHISQAESGAGTGAAPCWSWT